jgi:hypothetical protein
MMGRLFFLMNACYPLLQMNEAALQRETLL